MEPHIGIIHARTYTDLFGNSESPGKRKFVGYVDVLHRHENWDGTPSVYQVGIENVGDWCVSEWCTIPSDALWWVPGNKGYLATHVITSNLNFINTPLEHRYNLSVRTFDSKLLTLARNERVLWKGDRKTFIPFKRPHPQGYQGVWMSTDLKVRGFSRSVWVHDEFTSGHVLEFGYSPHPEY